MGDMVERALEETIPILRSAKKSKLLSAAEISEVVRQRRDHEYRLRGRDVPRAAFLEYASFEKELASLLNTRAKARNLKRSRVEQVVGATAARANLVYSRAVKRFKGDVSLWLYYARHCVESGGKRAAAKVFARAIAMRPDAPDVWLAAIAFHFDTCGDVTIARKIAQRALRAIPDGKQIWREYFRMELAFVAKAIARRIAIRVPVPDADGGEGEKEEMQRDGAGETASGVDMESSSFAPVAGVDETQQDEEGEEKSETVLLKNERITEAVGLQESLESEKVEREVSYESEEISLPKNTLTFWQGGVPLAVFRQAKRSIAMDVAELLEYWEISAHMTYAPPKLLCTIASEIDSCTANVCAVDAMLIRLNYDAAMAKLQHTLPPKVIALESIDGSSRVEQDTSVYDGAVAAVKLAAPKTCAALADMLHAAAPETDRQRKLLQGVIESFIQVAKKYLDAEMMESLRDELSALVKRREKERSGPDASKMSLAQVAQNGSFAAWSSFLNSTKGSSAKRKDEIRKVLKDCVAVPFRSKEHDRIAALWVSWEDNYLKTVETVHDLTAVPPSSKLVLEAAIGAMKAYLDKEIEVEERSDLLSMIRELYVKITGLMGSENDVDLWISYAEFERLICGNAGYSSAVIWKAHKVLSASNAQLFTEKLCLRTLTQ